MYAIELTLSKIKPFYWQLTQLPLHEADGQVLLCTTGKNCVRSSLS